METFVPWLLLLHVLGAVIAFGPSFAAPLMGGMGAKEPVHAGYQLRVSAAIVDKITIPFALLQGVTGVLLIIAAKFDLTQASSRWLLSAIVLYGIAIVFAIFVQRRNVQRLIALTSAPRPADAPPGPPAGAPALIKSIQRGGMLLTVLIVVIIALMVLKPPF